MGNKRIIMIEPSGKRGLIYYTHNLSNALAQLKYDVLVITSKNYQAKSLDKKYRVIELFDRFFIHPGTFIRFLSEIRRFQPGIIHTQGSVHPAIYYIFLKFLQWMVNSRFVYTDHEISRHLQHRTFLLRMLHTRLKIIVRLYNMQDRLIVHTTENKRTVSQRYDIASQKIEVIPHGDCNFFRQWKDNTDTLPHRAPLIPPHTPVVLFFGIITENKGLIHLIRAFQIVAQTVSGAKLLIVGQPFEDISKYLREIQDRGLKDSVMTDFRYLPIHEIPGYFEKADVVVLPYTSTTASGVIPVAYAFGKPVVATDCGGLPEQVEDGKSGIIVPVADEEKLAEAIITILQDKALQSKMGKYALWLAEHKNSWEEIASQTAEVYESVMSR